MNRDDLKNDLKDYKESGGTWAELSKLTGVPDATISRAASGRSNTDYDTWLKLHRGAPHIIRHPSGAQVEYEAKQVDTDYSGMQIPLIPYARIKDSEIATVIEGPYWEVPIFDAGMGEPSAFSDGGYPVGTSSDYLVLPKKLIDENTFIIRCHGDSMEPTLFEGDLVVVVPSKPLINGKLCFATWSDDELGDRLIKRYRKLPDGTVLLESDNKKYDPIALNEKNGEHVRIFKVAAVYNENV